MQKRHGELSALSLPAAAEGLSEHRGTRPVGTGRARAKAIVLGEHAVVYGAPALALPVPQLTVTATAGSSAQSPADPDDFSLTMTGDKARPRAAQASDGLHRLTAEFRAVLGVPDTVHLDVIIDCAIPVGRGLGSSAACARAVVHALADLFEREVTPELAFELVQTAENVAHGRASGVDAMAVGATAPLLFRAGRAQELPIGCEGLFIVADSGVAGRTKDAVELLRRGFAERPGTQDAFLRRATGLTETARLALAEGRPEQLGAQLTDYHELLRAGGLSTDLIDGMVEAALAGGGLGAKITGGGMGGCVIALARAEQAAEVTRRLLAAGAVQTWSVPFGGQAGHGR
ncbi:mevalonate kinase [Kitasatospora sp. NPDC056184]|uniref:mevalonate kinase n=1 Tax=Kitasatospora sp. NPDC056184 TaxID=3345738 RepID=UPI0035D6B6CC